MSFVENKDVNFILKSLLDKGYQAYVVGGCIRDQLLNKQPSDFDICTSASPDQIKELFSILKTLDTGLKHGTVTVILNHKPYEITTFRQEANYSDHRHPDYVTYTTDLYYDLARRDFTINALAYNQIEGIKDFFNGQRDLVQKTIRCVGNPDARFQEDALRILRAIRFAGQLGFTVESNTKDAIFRNKTLLNNLSVERTFSELSKFLLSDYGLKTMIDFKELFYYLVPSLKELSLNSYENIAYSIFNSEKDLAIRLAILLYQCPDWRAILNHFKVSTRLIFQIEPLITHIYDFIGLDNISIRYCLNELGFDGTFRLLKMQRATNFIDEFGYKAYENEIDNIIITRQPYSISQLAIDGNDLVELGYQNKDIGIILKDCLKKVIEKQLPNNREVIIRHYSRIN